MQLLNGQVRLMNQKLAQKVREVSEINVYWYPACIVKRDAFISLYFCMHFCMYINTLKLLDGSTHKIIIQNILANKNTYILAIPYNF